ncbi:MULTISPECIES: helix-turn-helix transcriptional regulator [Acidovorax]|uniref:Helix-turn-helix domain-containing protein n=1 Tax=Acidovorax facilis TaxID=12917 RepID=A0ABV8DIQ6_9BURK|nr:MULTISPECIES: helix-turn-helix transcriptional regulator [Acidovorax]KQB56129.1 hypothetical protein AE621_27875 [Acidovorax sp. SD340]MBO1011473.1 helix-turn-helix transcriptional regulator [Acidovorax sp. SD340]MCO4245312.1 helix-turn-helix domain-containing protein [Acidovorax facilis]
MQNLTTSSQHFLRSAREALNLTTTQAAALVHASRRSWERWESGVQRVPEATLELFLEKLQGRAPAPDGVPRDLVVVLLDAGGWTQPLDVVGRENFVHLSESPTPGCARIHSLAVSPTGRPYVHTTEFEVRINGHVIEKANTWTGLVAQLNAESPA